jgi:hypothetical protein
MATKTKRKPAKRPARKKKQKPVKLPAPARPWFNQVAVWSPVDWDHREVDLERCRASVSTPEHQRTAYYFHQCKYKGRHEEHGLKWCGRHLPSKVQARQLEANDLEIAKRDVKFLEKEVGRAYEEKMRWGKGPKAAERAAGAAYRRLEKARRKLRGLEDRRRK